MIFTLRSTGAAVWCYLLHGYIIDYIVIKSRLIVSPATPIMTGGMRMRGRRGKKKDAAVYTTAHRSINDESTAFMRTQRR